ncbi:MAG: hypothetical protein Q9163_005833 [Psora crenata]
MSVSTSLAERATYLLDFCKSMTGLVCGRIYPRLRLPLADLTGKVAIITGSNSGIGLQIALELARLNATVYLTCRDQTKADSAISTITAQVPAAKDHVKSLILDTSSLASVRQCAKAWETSDCKIDILLHNAGIGSLPNGQAFSCDGYPIIYATNLLGSFLLTNLLEPHLSHDSRVIFTSSTGQYAGEFSSDFSLASIQERIEPGFHSAPQSSPSPSEGMMYKNTKSMQVVFAKLLQRRWDRLANESGNLNHRTAHTFSPGFTFTPIFGKATVKYIWDDPLIWILCMTTAFATDVSEGAVTGVWLASTNDQSVVGEGMGGGYWDRMTRRMSKADILSTETLERMWIRWEADAGIEWR